jgi:WD40 repeat protein
LAYIYDIEESYLEFNFDRVSLMADGVMTVEWSTSSEWVLVTGGCDGAIRFWDIRRAGCFLVLDQSHSQLGRRPQIPECSATNKVFLTSFLFQKAMLALFFFLNCKLRSSLKLSF